MTGMYKSINISDIEELMEELSDACSDIEYVFYKDNSVLNSCEWDFEIKPYGVIHALLFEEEGAPELLKRILGEIETVDERLAKAAGGKCRPVMEFITVNGDSFEIDAVQGSRPIIVSFSDSLEVTDVRED